MENYELCKLGKSCWLKHIKELLCKVGLQEIWNNFGGINTNSVVSKLKEKLQSIYYSDWLREINGADVNGQHKLRTYCKFKQNFEMENYLKFGIPVNKRNKFCKLRISAHTLQIEAGRYTRPKTPVELRKCQLCHDNVIEDETHFVLDCNCYNDLRESLYNSLSTADCQFDSLTNSEKFKYIMNIGDGSVTIFKTIISYVNAAFDRRANTIGH